MHALQVYLGYIYIYMSFCMGEHKFAHTGIYD